MVRAHEVRTLQALAQDAGVEAARGIRAPVRERDALTREHCGRIADIVEVGLPHPRDLGSPEYGRIKNRLYELLGVSHAV